MSPVRVIGALACLWTFIISRWRQARDHAHIALSAELQTRSATSFTEAAITGRGRVTQELRNNGELLTPPVLGDLATLRKGLHSVTVIGITVKFRELLSKLADVRSHHLSLCRRGEFDASCRRQTKLFYTGKCVSNVVIRPRILSYVHSEL